MTNSTTAAMKQTKSQNDAMNNAPNVTKSDIEVRQGGPSLMTSQILIWSMALAGLAAIALAIAYSF
ncbi:MAG: hypothetical protein AAFV69_01960 [Pseudomonadota bacterium]